MDHTRHLRLRASTGTLGISATTREYIDAVQMLNYLSREGCRATVAIGGPHATAMPIECQRNGFGLTVTGEADLELSRLVSRQRKSSQIIHCGGVSGKVLCDSRGFIGLL